MAGIADTYGVRVVTIRTGGIPESLPKDIPGRETIADSIAAASLLGHAATLEDVGQVAAFVAVDDEPRYHLDIETDDVAAETARLVALGAVEFRRWLGCQILRAPGGHLLCVIPLHSDPESFQRLARVWE